VSTQNPVIDSGALTKEIIRDLIADEIDAWTSDGTTSLTDPLEGSRGTGAPFVLTSYPTQQTVQYPHVIVQSATITSESFDNRHDLHQAEVTCAVTIEGRTSTEAFNIRDGLLGFFTKNQEDVLRKGGWTDGTIDGKSNANWESDPETHSEEITASGTVYTN
jgi:hypothetical protein